MVKTNLDATTRSSFGKEASRRLRKAGMIPAVFYSKGVEAISMTLNPAELDSKLRGEFGKNVIFNLNLTSEDGSSSQHDVMLKAFQKHPVKRVLVHADFVTVDYTVPVDVIVPINLTGDSVGIKAGGTLRRIRRTIKLSCLPAAIPLALNYDISDLEIEDRVLASKLVLPEGVTIVGDLNFAFVQIAISRAAKKAATDEETVAVAE